MWKYVGKGEFIPGIPARDLTDAEAEKHLVDVQASPLYEKAARKGRRGKPESKSAEDR